MVTCQDVKHQVGLSTQRLKLPGEATLMCHYASHRRRWWGPIRQVMRDRGRRRYCCENIQWQFITQRYPGSEKVN